MNRIRRVKCDEVKPACNRCTTTGRKCDGYAVPQALPSPDPQKRLPQPLLPKNVQLRLPTCPVTSKDQDICQFDFFRNQTAQQLSGNFDAEFWNCILLQIGHSEPTVWHSIIAVGSLHEESIRDHYGSNEQSYGTRQIALDHYNKVIKRLTNSAENQESVDVILVSCLLFVCLELLLENVKGAMVHVHSGFSILESLKSEQGKPVAGNSSNLTSRSSLIEDYIVPIFHRLKIQVATFDRTHLARFSAKMSRNVGNLAE
jgi:hypothetical protein